MRRDFVIKRINRETKKLNLCLFLGSQSADGTCKPEEYIRESAVCLYLDRHFCAWGCGFVVCTQKVSQCGVEGKHFSEKKNVAKSIGVHLSFLGCRRRERSEKLENYS